MAENQVAYPSTFLLKQLYKNLYVDLAMSVRQKLYDSNKMKSTLIDSHSKTVCLPDIHRTVFSGAFGSKFLNVEKVWMVLT